MCYRNIYFFPFKRKKLEIHYSTIYQPSYPALKAIWKACAAYVIKLPYFCNVPTIPVYHNTNNCQWCLSFLKFLTQKRFMYASHLNKHIVNSYVSSRRVNEVAKTHNSFFSLEPYHSQATDVRTTDQSRLHNSMSVWHLMDCHEKLSEKGNGNFFFLLKTNSHLQEHTQIIRSINKKSIDNKGSQHFITPLGYMVESQG